VAPGGIVAKGLRRGRWRVAVNDAVPGSPGAGALRPGRAEQRDDRRAERGGGVHRPAVAAHHQGGAAIEAQRLSQRQHAGERDHARDSRSFGERLSGRRFGRPAGDDDRRADRRGQASDQRCIAFGRPGLRGPQREGIDQQEAVAGRLPGKTVLIP